MAMQTGRDSRRGTGRNRGIFVGPRGLRRPRTIAALSLVAGALGAAVAVGVPAGAATPSTFSPQGGKLVPAGIPPETESHVGRAVALSADGNTAVIGGPHEDHKRGTAWVYTRSGSTWSELTTLTPPSGEGSQYFGRSVAISADGSTAVVGDPGNAYAVGAAWVFVQSAGVWTPVAKLTGAGEVGPGQFGRSVAISADGNTVLVGAFADSSRTGAAWAFARSGASWAPLGSELTGLGETGAGQFGRSVALSADGTRAVIGGNADDRRAGAVWAFTRSGSTWSQEGAKLTGGGESGMGELGESVGISADGSEALAGAPGDGGETGAAFAFTRTATGWAQDGTKLTASDETGPGVAGWSVSLDSAGTTALVGGYRDNGKIGAAWAFTRVGGNWAQLGPKLTGAGEAGEGRFGFGVAVSGDGNTAMAGGIYDNGGIGAVWPFARAPESESEHERTGTTETTGSTGSSERKGGTATTTGSTAPRPGGQAVLSSSVVSPPLLGVTGNVAPLSGTVRVHVPHGGWVLLSTLREVPFGTIIDAREGHVLVTVSTSTGASQSGEFFDGEFVLTQKPNGLVTALLTGGSFASCHRTHHARRALASAVRKRVRKLWANAHGAFQTRGNYAAGAVQGTEWLTEDLCHATLIRVTRDKVKVTDLVHHRSKIVHAGHSLLVKAP
jgi:hypothetical protein